MAVGVGGCPIVGLVAVHRVRVVAEERLYQLAVHHHVAFAHTVDEQAHVEPFPRHRVCQAKGIAWKGVAQHKAVSTVYYAVAVAVDKAQVARINGDAYRQCCLSNLFLALEDASHTVAIIGVERHANLLDDPHLFKLCHLFAFGEATQPVAERVFLFDLMPCKIIRAWKV